MTIDRLGIGGRSTGHRDLHLTDRRQTFAVKTCLRLPQRAGFIALPRWKENLAFGATCEAHATEMAEDYVELIGDLIAERGEARVIDLAQHISVSKPTVAKIIQRRKTLGLVQNRPYRALFLTDAGKALATRPRERHQVVVKFLIALGIDPATVVIDSEGMEHRVIDATLHAMRRVATGSSAPNYA